MYFLAAKSTDRSLRLVLFAAFWSAVNRGLRPRGTLYFLTAKSTKNSPADACAYFVPANVRNGRLFAGLQANRPRFLPLLAGTSFDGSASGRNRSRRNAARSWRNSQIGYAESCHRPWKRVSTAAFSLGAEKEQPKARVPGAGGCKGLILLRPLSAGRRTVPRKATCGEFWVPFAVKRYKTPRGTRRKWASCFCEAIAVPYERTNMGEHANMGEHPLFACSCVRDESKPKPPAAT